MKSVCLVQVLGAPSCNCGTCCNEARLRRRYPIKVKMPKVVKKGGVLANKKNTPPRRYTSENFRSITSGNRLLVFERDGGRCRQCGSGDWLTLDHIVPRSKGGTNAVDNLQTLCSDCNYAKADELPELVDAI